MNASERIEERTTKRDELQEICKDFCEESASLYFCDCIPLYSFVTLSSMTVFSCFMVVSLYPFANMTE